MPQLDPLQLDDIGSEVRGLYDEMISTRGSVPNLFATLGHSREMLEPAIMMSNFLSSENTFVPVYHKQLAYLAVSRMNDCEYSLQRHAKAAIKAGLSPEQVESMLDKNQEPLDTPLFSEFDKTIIQFAEESTIGTQASAPTIEGIREEYTDIQFLELTYVVAMANMFNRLANGLEVELEPEFNR